MSVNTRVIAMWKAGYSLETMKEMMFIEGFSVSCTSLYLYCLDNFIQPTTPSDQSTQEPEDN